MTTSKIPPNSRDVIKQAGARIIQLYADWKKLPATAIRMENFSEMLDTGAGRLLVVDNQHALDHSASGNRSRTTY